VSEDDPAITFRWDNRTLEAIAGFFNNNAVAGAVPIYITTARGNMTADSLCNDIVAYAATSAGGRTDVIMLGPNTQQQYSDCLRKLQFVELSRFAQDHAALLPPGAYLGLMHTIANNILNTFSVALQ
jgi:hypothetical protein